MKACMYSSKRDWEKKDVARTHAILCKCKDGVSIFIITLPDFYLSIQDPIAIVARAPIFNIQAPWIPGPNAHCLETCRVCCDCPIVRLKAAGNEWPGGGVRCGNCQRQTHKLQTHQKTTKNIPRHTHTSKDKSVRLCVYKVWMYCYENTETQTAGFDVERFPDGFALSFQIIKIWFGGQWTEELHYLSEDGEQISVRFEPSHQKYVCW